MKGSVLAGGMGTRMQPMSWIYNKNVSGVFRKPLIYFPILTLKEAGIEDILIISGGEHYDQYKNLLGYGKKELHGKKELDVKLEYVLQDKPRGLSHGLSMAEEFAAGDPIIMILGDNIYGENLKHVVDDFRFQVETDGGGAKVILKTVPDPERFGVPEIKDGKIINIEEKPKIPKSNFSVTGFYMFDNRCFGRIKELKPSPRGELEITDLLNIYAQEGSLTYHITEDEWVDAGTPESLLKASMFVAHREGVLENLLAELGLKLQKS